LEGFHDESGLFAVFGHRDAAHLTVLGLHALQHRGGGGAAVAVSDGALVRFRRGSGTVRDAIPGAVLDTLPGTLAVGQLWGRPGVEAPADPDADACPLGFAKTSAGTIAVAASGRCTNGARLRRELLADGAVLRGGTDGELLVHLIARSTKSTFVNRIVDAAWRLEGAYALIVASEDRLVALRDPAGFRPLVLGRLGDATVLASEDAALRFVGAEVRREIAPGEMVILHERRLETVTPLPRRPSARCVMEHVSVARADATVFGRDVHRARIELGERLADAHPCEEADIVVGLHESGDAVAAGYARAHGKVCEPAFLSTAVTGRLPEPPGGLRHFGARLQGRVAAGAVAERTVALVSPTVVTGQVLRRAVRLLLDAGARGVHVRCAAPRAKTLCVYGLRPPTSDEIVAPDADVELAEWLGARSVKFLPIEELRDVLGDAGGEGLCDACLTGIRPVEPEEADDQLPLF
jgi:amidophosphoribosyltransferase